VSVIVIVTVLVVVEVLVAVEFGETGDSGHTDSRGMNWRLPFGPQGTAGGPNPFHTTGNNSPGVRG
jgi:hypothetical protein